jgi:hypothetical protein
VVAVPRTDGEDGERRLSGVGKGSLSVDPPLALVPGWVKLDW